MGPSWTALAFSVFAVVSGFFFTIINRTRPEPYMDEIFHVPQAQRYCQGRYTEVSDCTAVLVAIIVTKVVISYP